MHRNCSVTIAPKAGLQAVFIRLLQLGSLTVQAVQTLVVVDPEPLGIRL